MDWNTKILRPEDLEAIIQYELNLVQQKDGDPMELEMETWSALWRREALEQYLPLGWSFAVWSNGDAPKLLGYFIGQPFLFFRGMTQTLWVEHLNADSEEIKQHLVDVAYRTAREKHFQKVLFYNPEGYESHVQQLKSNAIEDKILEVKTAKF